MRVQRPREVAEDTGRRHESWRAALAWSPPPAPNCHGVCESHGALAASGGRGATRRRSRCSGTPCYRAGIAGPGDPTRCADPRALLLKGAKDFATARTLFEERRSTWTNSGRPAHTTQTVELLGISLVCSASTWRLGGHEEESH